MPLQQSEMSNDISDKNPYATADILTLQDKDLKQIAHNDIWYNDIYSKLTKLISSHGKCIKLVNTIPFYIKNL